MGILKTELHKMHRIMVQNIDDVLQFGAVFSELDMKAQNLKHHSDMYKKSVVTLNATCLVAIGAGASIILFIFRYWANFST